MRGRMNRRENMWRGQKRAMLRLALLAVSPIVIGSTFATPGDAQSPAGSNSFSLPPLPIEDATNGASKQINPFCQPAPIVEMMGASAEAGVARPSLGAPRATRADSVPYAISTIRLASGGLFEVGGDSSEAETSTVRLLPLVPIGEADNQSEEIVGGIKTNPLAEKSNQSQSVFQIPTPPSSETRQAEKTVVSPTIASDAVDRVLSKVTHRADHGSTAAKVMTAEAHEGPVSFSLNDSQLLETSVATKDVLPKTKSLASLLRNRSSDEAQATPPTVPQQKKTLYRSVTISEPMDEVSEPVVSITRGSTAGRTLLVPLPSNGESLPLANAPAVADSADARIVKGGRPRVDVGLPPVAIARVTHSHRGEVAPVAKLSPLVDSNPDAKKQLAVFETDNATLMEMKRTEVRALETPNEIRKVQIGDAKVCTAVAAGPLHLQLIGISEGVTRIAVWTASPEGKEQKSVYEVRVGTPVQSGANDPVNVAATLTKSTRAAFPESNLRVRHENGQMIVEGECESNEIAKKALRMIRSACLLPVHDKIDVR